MFKDVRVLLNGFRSGSRSNVCVVCVDETG